VYVKECGGGIAADLVQRLLEAGAEYVDISGNDGTSWAAVEGRLSQDASLGELFRDFGLPTAWILERLAADMRGSGKIVASGGIRNGLQGAKALALGASYFSMARPFLVAAHESPEAVIALGRRVIAELRTAMFLTGARECGEMDATRLLED
jgi:isopentenyl-diphosphate delta-isomerase